ncbi:Tumor necrosis factor ligand superfamily member 10 [Microtus ochrogaster]|uniref:Tumor necrosis factor ligand superfamily member 10 n=1 Tax=Microtus ochrogaster TaxID=79684 RepID=A0A8J6G6W7_MICOH|nr:Tumor necrosis factor ligand superfamily member 10 [Microtus ochrogaster]
MASTRTLKDPSIGQHFWRMLICTVLFQMLLQALSVAVTYVYFTNEMKQLQAKCSRSGLSCMLRDDEDPWDSTDEETRHCSQAKRHLYQVIEESLSLISLKSNQGSLTCGKSKDRPPPSRFMSKDGKTLGQKIESWESSRKGHSFLNYVHLRKGELVIQKRGVYFVYSQTYFRFQENEVDSKTVSRQTGKNKQMVQYIYKYTSYPDPILLMKSARNSCWSRDAEYGLYSIYQGGLFELKENDRIFVSVTNEHLMDLDQEASFFGVFLIN